MSLGIRIQKLREENNLSQEQLANRLDVSRQAISKWENALANPDIENILKLSKQFETTTDFLLTGKIDEVANSGKEIKTVAKKPLSTFTKTIIIIAFIALCGLAFFAIVPFLLKTLLGGN